ncbi:MAG: hypothetical protein WC824_07880 [Bacteroidota bacterium]|jgi:hypothetical protein
MMSDEGIETPETPDAPMKMGAKKFRDPLVLVLGELGGMKPKQEIDHKIVYAALCKKMDLTIGQFGEQKGSGTPWVELWTQWAFKDLAEAIPPLTIRMGKGKWALTPHGVAKARDLVGKTENTFSGAPMETSPVGNVKDGSAYHFDPYIRSLAIQETKCHDYFSDQSPICSECPIQGPCQNAQAKAFSDLARTLSAEDATNAAALKAEMARKATLEAAKAAAALHPGPALPVSSSAKVTPPVSTQAKFTGGQRIICAQGAICKKCNTNMAKGSDVIWIRGAGGTSGIFHSACYDELVQEGKADPVAAK